MTTPTRGTSFTETEREWVSRKWALIRASQQAADKCNNDWQRINAEIIDYLDRSHVTDWLERIRIKSQSLSLDDALTSGRWHAQNAQRHIDDVQLFLRLKELGLL